MPTRFPDVVIRFICAREFQPEQMILELGDRHLHVAEAGVDHQQVLGAVVETDTCAGLRVRGCPCRSGEEAGQWPKPYRES